MLMQRGDDHQWCDVWRRAVLRMAVMWGGERRRMDLRGMVAGVASPRTTVPGAVSCGRLCFGAMNGDMHHAGR